MKKFTKILALACAGLMLVGCGVSQGTADKINAAYATESTKDDWTWEKCLKTLGEPTVNLTVDAPVVGRAGIAQWVVGCKDAEQLSAKVEAGKEMNALSVTFAKGIAVSASFGQYNAKDSK